MAKSIKQVQVSIILPCYNEGPTFGKSIEKIILELKKLKKDWEIIFVEDKSADDTKKSVEKYVKKIQGARAIYHSKNEGRGKSVSDGIKSAKGKICGYLDVDLEVSEKYIPLFINEVENGYDMVVGQRFYEGGLKSFIRLLVSKVYSYSVRSILSLPTEDTESGYKFFRKSKIVPILPKVKSKHWFWDTEICAYAFWSGLKISQVPVIFKRRPEKKSTVMLIPDTLDYIKNLIRLKSQISNRKFQTNTKSNISNSKLF